MPAVLGVFQCLGSADIVVHAGRGFHASDVADATSADCEGPSRHFIGTANAIISSLVTCDPVSPPPVLTTVTNWRPSALLYVIGVVSTDDGSLISHSFSPVAVAKARNLKSSVPPTNVRPLAVSTTPPELGRPVSCMPGGSMSETPSVLR